MAARKKRPVNEPRRRGKNRDEPGGETITVTVTVNGIIDYIRSASITTEIGNSGNYRYTTDHGETVNHNRNQGYNELAKKLL
jgi:hypothetical protein